LRIPINMLAILLAVPFLSVRFPTVWPKVER
jgi:hypothetical protein